MTLIEEECVCVSVCLMVCECHGTLLSSKASTHTFSSALRLLTTCNARVCVCAQQREEQPAGQICTVRDQNQWSIQPHHSATKPNCLPQYHTHNAQTAPLSLSIRAAHIVSHLWVILIFKYTYKNHLKTSTPDAWTHKYTHSPPHILYISCALSLISLSRCLRTRLTPAGSLEMLFLLNTRIQIHSHMLETNTQRQQSIRISLISFSVFAAQLQHGFQSGCDEAEVLDVV